MERSGKTVGVAGNIGPSLLDTLAQKREAGALPQVWVLELSSLPAGRHHGFAHRGDRVERAAGPPGLAPAAWKAYAAAKARIFGKAATMTLNREDQAVMKMLPEPVRLKGGKYEQRKSVTFGAEPAAARPGDFGLEVVHDMAWLVRAHEADEAGKAPQGRGSQELHLQRLMPADALRIRGRHNAVNALAALAPRDRRLLKTAGPDAVRPA